MRVWREVGIELQVRHALSFGEVNGEEWRKEKWERRWGLGRALPGPKSPVATLVRAMVSNTSASVNQPGAKPVAWGRTGMGPLPHTSTPSPRAHTYTYTDYQAYWATRKRGTGNSNGGKKR